MPIPYYNTTPPTPTTKNTINSIMSTLPNIRDFLLLKNLSPQYPNLGTTINGSPKIGEPVLDTMVGNGSNSLPIGLPLETEGILWKHQNVLPNTFKNVSTTADNLSAINYIPDIPYLSKDGLTSFGDSEWPLGIQSYPAGANDEVTKYGIYGKSLNAKFKNKITAKNLYLDVDKQIDMAEFIDLQPVDAPQQIKGYLDTYGGLNLGGSGGVQAANVIGSVVNGQGLGLAKGGVVTNFDIRSSLAGRVLGATGMLKDTKLGLIGGQQLALALANNAAFNLQQDILGAMNIQDNVLSLVKGEGFAAFPRPDYSITIPGSNAGRVGDYTSRLLGFTIPRSYVTNEGSIFQSESGEVDNITRANALIGTTGKGQLQALLTNINVNLIGTSPDGYDNPTNSTFRSGYAPGYKTNNKNDNKDTLTANMYAFQKGDGMVSIFSKKDGVISDLSYLREERVTGKDGYGFEDPTQLGFVGHTSNKGYDDRLVSDVAFSWGSYKGGNVNTDNDYSDLTGNRKSLLVKTQKLFNSVGMLNIVTAKGDMNKHSSQISQANGNGFSKGNAVMKQEAFTKNGYYDNNKNRTADETYCRSWTTLARYDSVSKLVRNDGLYSKDSGKVPFRFNTQNSVLEDTGFVKIAPYTNDFLNPNVPRNAKNYMLSIENLAWHDRQELLPKGELGQGDPVTGKRGRMMWFPPYDIQISESTSVDWESNKFIGRGENVYTYNNTERSGQLSFKIIVDHSTYSNSFRGDTGPDDHYVASFMAGCIEPDSFWTDKFTVQQNSSIVPRVIDVPQQKVTPEPEVVPEDMKVFFPNDNANFDGIFGAYENGQMNGSEIDYTTYPGTGGGIGPYRGKYTSNSYWPDNTNWGLNYSGPAYSNSSLTPSKVGDKSFKGFFSPGYYEALVDYLKTKCKYCRVTVIGHASDQGENTPNAKLAKDRANYVLDLLKKNVGKPMGLTDSELNKRFTANLKASTELPTGSPVEITYEYPANSGNIKKVKVKISNNGCKVCPKLEKGEAGGISKEERYIACPVDTMGCKLDRYASITFQYDADAALADIAEPKPCHDTITEKITTTVKQKFYNETMFFDKLLKTDKFIFDSFREKIKYFHPAFHSTTPEGLNSRLTFLQQCTRQGPTDNMETNNLAFGRAPVCILRVGDFYNTKIIIDSLNIEYEPLVWDLNPEGIGVQPMIANVSLSFKFIGGESLYGPINKLQNALSFNYYANSGVYEARADYISEEKTLKAESVGPDITSGAGTNNVELGEVKLTLGTSLKLQNGVLSTREDQLITSKTEMLSRVSDCDPSQVVMNDNSLSQSQPQPQQQGNSEPKIIGFDNVTFIPSENLFGEGNDLTDRAVTITLKSEGIQTINDDGTVTKLISDDELKTFISKNIKITVEKTPTPSNTSRVEEMISWDTISIMGKNPWDLFGGVYFLGTKIRVGEYPSVTTLPDEGNYMVTVTYDGNVIQTIMGNASNTKSFNSSFINT